jgi:hypothetical protein
MTMNFILMLMCLIAKILIRILFGQLRSSELTKGIDSIKFKFYTILYFLIVFKLNVNFSKIFLVLIYFFMSFITAIAFKRGSYICSLNEKNKLIQIKIIFIYLFFAIFNYYFYETFYTSLNDLKKYNNFDLYMNFIISQEFLILFIKCIAKFYKLIVLLTCINLDKIWEKRLLVFSIISLIKHLVNMILDIKQIYFLISLNIIPINFIIESFIRLWNIFKLIMKIYKSYQSTQYINNLIDYDFNKILKNFYREKINLTEEEKEKIKNDKIIICNICLCEIERGKYLNCGHIFHLKCIKEWVIVNSNCPICKESIINENKRHSSFYNRQVGLNNNNNNNNNFNNFNNYNFGFNNNNNNYNNLNNNNDNNLNDNERMFENNEVLFDKTNIENNIFNYGIKKNEYLEKYYKYKKLKEIINELESDNIINKNNNNNNNNNEIKSGSITYSLPCEALTDRNIDNELKRLEIEITNNKIIEMYIDPENTINQYKDKID